jgi:hypothetical protein
MATPERLILIMVSKKLKDKGDDVMKILSKFIILGLALVLIHTSPLFGSSIVVSDSHGNPGDTAILVTISLKNTVPYAGSELTLQYNSTKLILNRIESAARLSGQSGTGYYEYTTGKASFVVFDFSGVSLPPDSGAIFNLYFDLCADSCGVGTEISISEITAVSDNLLYDTVTVKNGSISIRGWGDCNGDYIINLGDVVFLITYLYRSGPAPQPLWTADVTRNGEVNIGDVVYLITYLYKNGPPPCQTGAVLFARQQSTPAELSLYALNQDKANVQLLIDGTFDVDVFGAQLELGWDKDKLELSDISQTERTERLQLYHNGGREGQFKAGMVDINGKEYIPAGEGALLTLKMKSKSDSLDLSSLEIKEAILVDQNGQELALRIDNKVSQSNLPKEFSLSQNYPNPSNPQTVIQYALPRDCKVQVTIYNILGQKVRTLVNENQKAGYKRVEWDSKNDQGEQVASGIYFYKIKAGEFSESKKMVILK